MINNTGKQIHARLKQEGCLLKKSDQLALRIIEEELDNSSSKYDYDNDFKFINSLIEKYSSMFFEEQLTKRAMSFFKHNSLGGDISDSDFEDCLQLIASTVFGALSGKYKQRLSLYLTTEDHQDDDDGIITFIYLAARQLLFSKSIEYNKTMAIKASQK